jgi:hypothetical protein
MICRQSYHYRNFIGIGLQSSLCQTPIRIEATLRDHSPKRALSAHCGPENLRLRAGSISYLIPWFFYQSYMAPSPGSKDADNSSFDGCDNVPVLSMVEGQSVHGFTVAPFPYANIRSGMNETLSLIM